MAGPYSLTTKLVRGKVARFTLLDACGLPVATKGTFTTNGFMQVQATKNYDNGDEIKVRRADGLIDTFATGRRTFMNYSLQIDLTRINPGVVTMLTGDPGVLDWQTTLVGWEEREFQPISANFALEIWTATAGVQCTAGSLISGYVLYPGLYQATMDLDNITDKEINLSIKADTFANPSWGKGPYGGTGSIPGPVASDATPTASRLLQPVATDAHRHVEFTPIAPPSPTALDGPATYTLPSPY